MRSSTSWCVFVLFLTLPFALLACAGTPAPAPDQTPTTPVSAEGSESCEPTPADALGPFYQPNAPLRERVGEGYILRGVVRSSSDCSPIPGAQIEIWMAGPDGAYADEFRATLFANEEGSYQFESHVPPPYSGRPPHHHFRLSAPGYQTLVTQHYPEAGATEAVFDLVLVPEQ